MAKLKRELDEFLGKLAGLRDRIRELRYTIKYRKKGITLYFAVDFSELFSYLHLTREEEAHVKILGVTLDSQNAEQNALQYRLGLTHLFDSFVIPPLYVLPSHIFEMWSYVRTQAEKNVVTEDQAERLLEGIRSLAPESKSLLESLERKEQSQVFSQQLLSFVKSPEFASLCVDVSELVSWHKTARVLETLFQKQVISPRIDDLLTRHGIDIAELKEPSPDEIAAIFSMFPEKLQKRSSFNTRIDARAFIFLRNLNRLLARANARLILVTRDPNLLQIAKTVSHKPELEWTEAHRCLRGIETMFLDLTLTSTPSDDSKLQWICQSHRLLNRMQKSVDPQAEQSSEGSSSRISPFLTLEEKVLKETAQLWDQHINLKLSLASDSTTPLGKAFLKISEEQFPDSLKPFKNEYQILKNLIEYFSTNTYRTAAIEDVKAVWEGIEIDLLRIQFLDILGKDEATSETLAKTLTSSFKAGATKLHSKRPFKMPPIRLISKTHQDKLSTLRTVSGERYEKVLFSIIKEVVVGFDEPEDLFFMAYLLGLLDAWELALELTEKCRNMISNLTESSLPTKIIPSEVDYFLSAIKIRLARASTDPVKAADLYLSAYQDVKRALDSVADDPRYLMNQAALVMLYYENVKEAPGTTTVDGISSAQPKLPSEAEAAKQLKEALAIAKANDDVELIIKMLNNLAYAEVIADKPSFEAAQDYIRQMDDALAIAIEKQKLLYPGFLVHVNATKIMLKARRALEEKKVNDLRECVAELERINSDPDLIEYEKVGFSSDIVKVNSWTKKVETRS